MINKIFCFIDSILSDKTISHLFKFKMTNNNLTQSYFKIDYPKRKYRRTIFGIEESNLIHYPMNYLLSSIANVAIKPISWTTNQILNLIYKFIINIALPWLLRFLNEIKKLNILPSRLNDLIELFNNIYYLMKLFGYIKTWFSWFLNPIAIVYSEIFFNFFVIFFNGKSRKYNFANIINRLKLINQ